MVDPEDEGGGPVGAGEREVREAECVSSIAERTGHFWQTIWDDPANAEVKRVRRDPSVLLPGDRLTIPPLREKHVDATTGRRHRFRRRGVPSKLELRLLKDREPRADVPYRLVVDDTTVHEGRTDGDGGLCIFISPNARRGVLVVGTGDTADRYELALRRIAPVETIAGVQQRLNNLGYACGPEDGRMNDETRAALALFQAESGLAETGAPDAATRDELLTRHGS